MPFRYIIFRAVVAVLVGVITLVFLPMRIGAWLRGDRAGDHTIKLYRQDPGGLAYWTAWPSGKAEWTVHGGPLGERGDVRQVSLAGKDAELARRRAAGFAEIPDDDHHGLEIVYRLAETWGAPGDLEKRYRLQDRLDATLAWSGLGHVDGGSIGSGTMEVFCMVVDPGIARRVIEADLAGTEFAGFCRIDAHPPISRLDAARAGDAPAPVT
jgi:hypothetical protein